MTGSLAVAAALGVAGPPAPAAADPVASHVFVVMMENTDWSSVQGSSHFPYVNQTLLPNFASASDYRSGLHPSLPNYVELEAGATLGLTSGSYLPTDHSVSTTAHLTTQLTGVGLDWKYYAENLPGGGGTCNLTDPGVPYSEDHNPFVYFQDVQSDPAYCIQHERPYSELATDLAADTVPQYSFIVPNDWDQGEKLASGSSCAACQADAFLSTEIPKIQASAAYRDNGVILVLWDESAGTDTNPSGLIVVSNLAKKGYVSDLPYNHGSTLRTVQEIFGLSPLLGDAATATDLRDLFATSPFPAGTGTTAPNAAFTADPTTGPAPLPVTFTDTSTGAPTSWSWDFGDGGTSTEQNPSHTYAADGTYPVTLTAANDGGTATASASIVVGAPAPAAPTASFTATPTSGSAPLTVAFTDTSTGGPTSWSWDFGDGTGSTQESPSHTYTAAGTFTATLTASNAAGATSATGTVSVAGAVGIGASTSARSSGSTRTVKLARPAGVAAGDLLVAQIDADGLPTVSTVPSGWHALTGRLVTKGSALFAYYRTVADPTKEPSSYTFTLSTAKTWNAGISDFTHVNAATPFDTAAATKAVTSSTTRLSVGAVTTKTPGALLIGGAGLNSTTVHIAAPSGWTEAWEADGGQDVDLATRPMTVASSSGTATFALSASTTGCAWIRALRPAG